MANLLHNEIFKYLNQVIRLALNYKYNQLEAKQKKKTKKKMGCRETVKVANLYFVYQQFQYGQKQRKNKVSTWKKMIRD